MTRILPGGPTTINNSIFAAKRGTGCSVPDLKTSETRHIESSKTHCSSGLSNRVVASRIRVAPMMLMLVGYSHHPSVVNGLPESSIRTCIHASLACPARHNTRHRLAHLFIHPSSPSSHPIHALLYLLSPYRLICLYIPQSSIFQLSLFAIKVSLEPEANAVFERLHIKNLCLIFFLAYVRFSLRSLLSSLGAFRIRGRGCIYLESLMCTNTRLKRCTYL